MRFREKWRIALAHIRQVLTAGFELTAVVADADYGSNAAFRRGLERLGLRYGLAIRSVLTLWTSGARRTQTAATIATALGGVGQGPLRARFAAVRVRPAITYRESSDMLIDLKRLQKTTDKKMDVVHRRRKRIS